MPNEFSDVPYSVVRDRYHRKMPRTEGQNDKPLPLSDKKTLDPKYLLEHQNRFDPNSLTPDDMMRNRGEGILPKPILKA